MCFPFSSISSNPFLVVHLSCSSSSRSLGRLLVRGGSRSLLAVASGCGFGVSVHRALTVDRRVSLGLDGPGVGVSCYASLGVCPCSASSIGSMLGRHHTSSSYCTIVL
jgi:hypothetical protein